jgi:tRNA(fMet)-specific endonuclease VapC
VIVWILDTDALTLIQRRAGARTEALIRLLETAGDHDVYVTVISLDEQVHGALAEIADATPAVRIRGYRRLHALVIDYSDRPMLDYDDAAEAIFDRLKRIKGRPATKDLRIASIALSHDATLVTGNVRDFERVPGLKIRRLPA